MRTMRKQYIPRLLVLVALGFLTLGMVHIGDNYQDPHPGVAVILVGMTLGVIAFALEPSETPSIILAVVESRFERWRWLSVGCGVVMILVLSIAVGNRHTLEEQARAGSDVAATIVAEVFSYNGQLGLWLGGMAFLLAGLIPGTEWRAFTDAFSQIKRKYRRKGVALVLLFSLALGVRLVLLETGMPILFGDEAPFGSIALSIMNGDIHPTLFEPGHLSHPLLFHYILSRFMMMIGESFAAIRLFPALVGALTVPALVWLGYELFDRRVGWMVGFFLATYPVHVHFSRLALNNVVDPFFLVMALAALTHGLRRGGRWGFVVAGLALGLSQYFYAGGRLGVPLLAGYVVFLTIKQPGMMRARWSALAALVLVFLMVTLPANTVLLAEDKPLTTRFGATDISLDGMLLTDLLQYQIAPAFMAFIHTADAYFFYGGATPLLLAPAAIFFLVGVAYLIQRWLTAHAQATLILAWLTATALFGGAVLDSVPGYARYVIACPAIALVAALGMARICDIWSKRFSGQWALVLMLPVVVHNGLYYFDTHMTEVVAQIPDYGWQIHDLGLRTAALNDDTIVHLVVRAGYPSHLQWVVHYMAGSTQIVWHTAPVEQLVDEEWFLTGRAVAHAFFIAPDRQIVINDLIRHYPEGVFIPAPNVYPNARPLMLFYVPVGAQRTAGSS